MVLNYARLLDKDYKYVYDDVSSVVGVIGDVILKVIIETSQLQDEDIIAACIICVLAGAHYVKTSTGFVGDGAQQDTFALMKAVVGDKVKLKSSGGIRDRETALKFISIGADRIGTSSGVGIVKNNQSVQEGY
ncbi:deoxyribose-phosphate aldolase [Acrasis kona]